MGHYPQSVKMTHHQRQQADFKQVLPLLIDAKLQKAWLYHKGFGRWYTPDEFEKEYSTRFLNNWDVEQLLENIVVRDPRRGNSAFQKAIRQKTQQYQKEIAELTLKGEAFLNKVIDYYQEKSTGI